jgi:hypothetical protein
MQITLEEAAYIAQLIGVVAVIVSLVYLAMQLRQNNKMIRLGTLHDISSLYVTCMLTISHDQESTDLWVKGLAQYDDLGPDQRSRFVFFAGATVRTLAEQFYQWEQGALDPSTWEGMKGLVEDFAQYPGFRAYWGLRGHQFSPGFRNYVETTIRNSTSLARPMFR